MMAAAMVFASPSYCAGELGVQPPSNWESTGPQNDLTGTLRTISDVLPRDWKENNEYTDKYGGTCSNKVFFNADGNRYRVDIWLDPAGLTSGPNFIPLTYKGKPTFQYILTYVYAYYGAPADPRNGAGQGNNMASAYTQFTTSQSEIYRSTLAEGASGVQGQFQFKYAIAVPDNQAQGTYNGIIRYQVIRDDTFAVINSGSVGVKIVIGSLFRLSVDRGTVDFENMKPGDTKDNVPVEGVIVKSKTNVGNPWYLKISNDNPLSNGPYMIPNSNLIWYGWTVGKGTWYGNGTDQMSLVPMLVYAGGMSEGVNLPDGTDNHLKFKLAIPKGQPGGKYLSTIKFTMTE